MKFNFSFGQTDRLKAVFMYNFTRYIDWPSEKKEGDFKIAILGNSPLTEELRTVASKKNVGAQKILIKNISSLTDEDFHIVFISAEKSAELGGVLNKYRDESTLVITDKKGLIQKGAGINFSIENGKLIFEINKGNIEKNGLKVSSQLLSLGKQVQ
jgi:hypothetical protein